MSNIQYNIIQGNTYNIPFHINIDISKVQKVQVIIHDIIKVYPKELQFIDNIFYMSLTEQETFALPLGKIKYQIRLWYISSKVSASYTGEMQVHEVLTYRPISKNQEDNDFSFNEPIEVKIPSDIDLPVSIITNINYDSISNQLSIDYANGTVKKIDLFNNLPIDYILNKETNNLDLHFSNSTIKTIPLSEVFATINQVKAKQDTLTTEQINNINNIVNLATKVELQQESNIREQSDINNKNYIDTSINLINKQIEKSGAKIAVESDLKTHNHTFKLLNAKEEVLNEVTINIPLEEAFVAASWDESKHTIIFTLQNGNQIEIPIGSILQGVVTDEVLNQKLQLINLELKNKVNQSDFALKQDKLSEEQIKNINLINSISTAIQDLEIDKLDVKIIPIAGKKVSQLDARTLIDNYKQYEGYELHFYTNGDNPTNFVAKGFLVCDENFDPHLILTDGKGVRYEYDSQGFRVISVSRSDLVDKLNVARYILDSSEIGPDNYITQETAAFIINAVDRGYDNRFIEFLNGTIETVVFATGYIMTGKDGIRRLIVIYSDGKIISYTNIDYVTPFVTEEQMIGVDTKINRTMQLVQQLSQRVVELENKVK